jgi:hypothetical protein
MKEAEFEKEFQLVAQTCGCVWVKIPDAILTAETRFRPERKRPADGVLIMQCGVMLIELKIGWQVSQNQPTQLRIHPQASRWKNQAGVLSDRDLRWWTPKANRDI